MKTYTAENGIPFAVRILNEGDSYGLNDSLTYNKDNKHEPFKGSPMIEFYDTRYDHTKYGQFVARYYWKTLFDGLPHNQGINLHGGVPDWSIDGNTYSRIMNDLISEIVDKKIVAPIEQNKHITDIYDNFGESLDRYTIFTDDEYDDGNFICLSCSDDPTHPLGFSQFSEGKPGDHCGVKIAFSDLPENVQKHVNKRLGANQ